MKFSKLNLGLLLLVAATNASDSPIGFGKNTTGGKGGAEYHVHSYKELKEALDNHGNPNGPKIIYIDSPINGSIYEDGSAMTAESLVPGYSLGKYLNCFNEEGSQWLDTEECNEIENLRLSGIPLQRAQTEVFVTPNTSIIGNGNDALVEELSLQISHTENVIVKNLSIEAPNDFFAEWDPTDGIHGSWNAEYDAMVIRNSTNVWIDNCYLTDGKRHVGTQPFVFNKYVELHDGLLDIVDASNFVTVSNNRFENHQKTMIIGSKDSAYTDRDHLKVTIFNNVFLNTNERHPRVRFGHVHVFNNYFYAETFHPYYPSYTVDNYFHDDTVFPQYFIGLGVESNILSEYNSFNYIGNDEIPGTDDIVVYSYGGFTFHDQGSEFNGQSEDFDALAEKSFHLKVKTKMAQNAAKGKSNPAWVNATFTTETFNPLESYDYQANTNMDEVNDLINKVPTWMFNLEYEYDEEDQTISDDIAIEVEEDSFDSEEETTNAF
eukprot:jgi/Orpsp1_1/1185073/evm.model.c7180000092219.1